MHFRDSPDSLNRLGIPGNNWFRRFTVTYTRIYSLLMKIYSNDQRLVHIKFCSYEFFFNTDRLAYWCRQDFLILTRLHLVYTNEFLIFLNHINVEWILIRVDQISKPSLVLCWWNVYLNVLLTYYLVDTIVFSMPTQFHKGSLKLSKIEPSKQM